MPFNREIICLAISRKWGGKCVAGKDTKTGEWIRPISDAEHEEVTDYDMSYENKKMPQLLDIIKIPFKEKRSTDIQPENMLINSKKLWEKIGKYPKSKLDDLCDNPEVIFVNEEFWKDKVSPSTLIASGINTSLLLIKPVSFRILRSNFSKPGGYVRKKVRARFTYKDIRYDLSITDPLIEIEYYTKREGIYQLDSNNIYICISIGNPWEDDGYCYKFVASVIVLD